MAEGIDNRIRSYFPDWRVYIFGVDVTEDLVSCNISYNDGRAPNTAEIELVSKREIPPEDSEALGISTWSEDRYIVDQVDIRSMYAGVNLNTTNLAAKRDRIRELGTRGAFGFVNDEVEEETEQQLEQAIGDFEQALAQSVIERINLNTTDPLKERVLSTKVQFFQSIQDVESNPFEFGSGATVGLLELPQLTGRVFRYPYQVGDCIFHTNDPVRIFWRDPTKPEQWYHMFSGYITDSSDVVDQNDQRTVRIRMEDASRVLRYARITTNPGILDITTAATENDAVLRTFFNSNFAELTLPEVLFLIIFGSRRTGIDVPGTEDEVPEVRTFSDQLISVNGIIDRQLDLDSLGSYNFEQSFVALWGPPSEDAEPIDLSNITITNLGEYQSLVDHRVYFSDLDNMYGGGDDARLAELKASGTIRRVVDSATGEQRVIEEDVVRIIGENPHLFPVDFGRLVLLVPNSLGPDQNRDLLLKDLTGVATQTSWNTRLGLIYDICERIDFSFYCSPRGDLICEMPLYDFEPRDFSDDVVNLNNLPGLNQRQSVPAPNNPNAARRQLYTFSQFDAIRGPYGPAYRVNKSDTISWDRTFSDERIRTQMRGVYNLIPGFAQTGGDAGLVGEQVHLLLPALIPQFGVRSETIDPKGIINNKEAAEIYALVKLNQMNAEARTAKVDVLPRVTFGFPNRPVEFAERNYVGTLAQITHALVWGLQGDMTMGFDVKYIRGWAGQVDTDQNPVYEPIGGFASNPLNYALRFGQRPGVSNNTVTSIRGGTATTTRR